MPGEVTAETQPLPTQPAPFARQIADRGHADQSHAGGAPVGARAVPEIPQRGPVRAARASARRRSSFPASTAARNGAARPSIRRPACSTSMPTRWPGPASLARTDGSRRVRPAALPHALRDLPSRRPDRRAAADPVAGRTLRGRRASRPKSRAIIRQGAGRMPGFPNLSRQRAGRGGRSTC